MRTNAFRLRFVLCALCALALWSAPAFSQRLDRGLEVDTIHSNAQERPNVPVEHALHDWTHDHMLYPRFGPMNRLIELQKDPRAIQHWQESYRKDYVRWRRGGGEGHRSQHHNRSAIHRDWNIFIGGTMDNGMYPAKWTFDPNETVTAASCTTDYLVAPVDNTGNAVPTGAGQPDIVGLDNLYSGTAPGPTGLCNRTPAGTDDGVSATALFSYAVIADDGLVTTSPVTSMDGNLIAFVEEGSGVGVAHFHVLAWHAGDGVNATPDQDVFTFLTTPITTFVSTPPVVGSGQVTDLVLPGGTDTFSSPYVEYTGDVAYVGDDFGNIYRIQHVFCPSWAPCAGAAPSLDPTWGTGGVLNIDTASLSTTCTGATGNVTGITVDGVSGNIFAGCADGNLYAFTPTGASVPGSPLLVGDGNASNGGIVDPPILDNVNGWVYVETGSCVTGLTNCVTGGVGTGAPVLVQASVANLATNSVAALGPGGNFFNIHAPAFNDAYFTSGSTTDWLLYEFSSDNAGPTPPGGGTTAEIVLYGVTFGSGHAMTGGTPPNALGFTGPGAVEVSPVTEFLTTGGEDRIFASAFLNTFGNIVSFEINLPPSTPSVFPTGVEGAAQEGVGTSGIVGDNASPANQANSIYFGTLGTTGTNSNSIVKLTQSASGGNLQ